MMAPRLWMMTTYSSSNFNLLRFQRVKGQKIMIWEYPVCIWSRNTCKFHQALLKYLRSFTFCRKLLVLSSSPLTENDRTQLLPEAKGVYSPIFIWLNASQIFISRIKCDCSRRILRGGILQVHLEGAVDFWRRSLAQILLWSNTADEISSHVTDWRTPIHCQTGPLPYW